MEASCASIFTLDEIADPGVGGKAWGLSRLVAMGLPVPPAFVIHNAAQGEFPPNLDEHYAALGGGAVAVRSSAEGEDGADASFAGQYDTVLNVQGEQALREAIDQCVASIDADRAASYQQEKFGDAVARMNVVVQVMVDASCAGVVFTADPVSGRRDIVVVDAIEGLGEALVSGEATPDHYRVDLQGEIFHRELTGDSAILSDAQVAAIARGALEAQAREGHPLDLEWAIDAQGTLYWLQARPVTTLPADLNEFDTELPRPGDVLTISNVSEMMPGAVCPLTGSFTGWSIDYGLQHMQVVVGARPRIENQWQVTAWGFGHLFLNLTGNIVMSAGVLGSTPEQAAQTLCGRIVPELKPLAPQPFWRRAVNTLRLFHYALTAPKVVDRFADELAAFRISDKDDSAAMWQEVSRHLHFYEHSMAVHIQSSALSGFLSAIVENMVAGQSNDSTGEEQGRAVQLLAGATGVESALMLEELDALVDLVAAHPDAPASFRDVEAQQALTWLLEDTALARAYEAFMGSHGHRGYRELCMRDPAWVDDPLPLVQSMQAAVRGRLSTGGHRTPSAEPIDWPSLDRGLRWILPKAHNAVRRREHTKSQLVDVAHRYKRAFRRLGELLTNEGKLPDADLVYFFSIEELPGVVANCGEQDIVKARLRRDALEYQQRFEFPEISVGHPQPIVEQEIDCEDGVLIGRPASRGSVEGLVRVAHTLEEASALQAGEILVAPITDIGWTPYFSLIGALVTDLGSAVSHGAVIAREYGLPCVVNSRQGTRVFCTGDRVRVDGDSGRVERLAAAADQSAS